MRYPRRMRALLVAVVMSSSIAVAQDDAREQARVLFEQGTEALRNRRFTEAIEHLEGSLELFDNPGTAFNLANALRGAGRTLDAITVFDRLIADAFGTLRDEERAQATQLREEARAELGTVRVRVEGPGTAEIRIDGERADDTNAEGRGEYRVDAGEHVVDARAEGFRPEELAVQLARGQERELSFVLERVAERIVERRVEAEPSRAWIGVLVGVLVAGAVATTLGLVLRDREGDPFVDGEFGVTQTLSAR